MKRRLLLKLVCCIPMLASVAAAESTSVTLDRVLSVAAEHHVAVRQAAAAVTEARGQRMVGRSGFMPQVEVVGGYQQLDPSRLPRFEGQTFGSSSQWSAALQVRQSLWQGGGQWWSATASGRQFLAAEHGNHAALQSALLDTGAAYTEAYAAQRAMHAQKSAVEQLRSLLEATRARRVVGEVPELELLRAEVEYENARVQLVQARRRVESALLELNAVIGRPVVRPHIGAVMLAPPEINGPPESVTRDVKVLRRYASAHQPQLQRLQSQLRAVQAQRKATYGAWWPHLSLNAAYGAEKNRFSRDPGEALLGWQAGLELNWSLFSGMRDRGATMQAVAAVADLEARIAAFKRELRLELSDATAAVREARHRLQAIGALAARAQQALDVAQARYAAGAAIQLEVLEARTTRTEVAVSEARARADYVVAVLRLAAAAGVLDVSGPAWENLDLGTSDE